MNTFYFSHDYGARNDPKMQHLMMKSGMEGVGLYWCLIELLYEQEGYLMHSQCDGIAFALHTDTDRIATLLTEHDLFTSDGEKFWSESVLRRLEIRNSKSGKARESALKRWNNANALRTECDGNAIKESKVKESKVKENKEKEEKRFCPPSLDEVKIYFNENGFSESSALQFFNGYNVANWHDSQGKQIKVWKQKAQQVWFKDENRINGNHAQFVNTPVKKSRAHDFDDIDYTLTIEQTDALIESSKHGTAK
ncbi:MAG: DUF4373 domain-containing protein [Bacteroidales bacterium]|nr:DUF4373 domain-containing protein [Bacteroidales bacterium]